MKRIFLFLATNLAILIILGIVLNVLFAIFGVQGSSTTGLLILALVFGMGGSFISLAMSKWIAKRTTGAMVIETPSNEIESWLVNTVSRQAMEAGIGQPEVAIFNASEMNAFATGMNKNNALVAVSTGLLHDMERAEVEAVLAHEVSHIANGDMVTLALIQGVLNTFVIILARIIGGFIDRMIFSNSDNDGESASEGGIAYFVITILAEIVLGVLASIIVMWFSRKREFSADSGGSDLAGNHNMIAALKRLQNSREESHLPEEVAAFGLNGKKGFMSLFSSHPPIEERISALRMNR
jgi:heat shock protein HtpX